MWIFAFWLVNTITMVISENEGPLCRQLDNNEDLFPAKCSKIWLTNIDKTIMYTLRQNNNFEKVIRNLNARFYSIANHCSYKRWVQWDDNLLRPNDRTLCGVRMINKFNIIEDKQESILITVDKQFALNLTFTHFRTDEYYADSCSYINVRIIFLYSTGTCHSKPKQGMCGYRHPWSVIVPSHRVLIYVTYIRMINPLKIHVAYQVVEKCRQQMSLKDSHISNIQYLGSKYYKPMAIPPV